MSHYKAKETDFLLHSPAFVLQTGIGFHGTYTLRGTIRLRDNTLFIHGRVAIPLAIASREIKPDIEAYMDAELYRMSGEKLMAQRFNDARGSIIPTDWHTSMNVFLGGVEFVLPLPPEPLSLTITGNVVYTFTEGKVVANPAFPPAQTFAVEVEE